MSHTNTTTNYGLPQFLSTDKPAWMADINVAFSDIDSQMKLNADAASGSQGSANNAILNEAPGYSNLSTYAVGDVVSYQERTYKCVVAVTVPEAFDSGKWTYYRLSDASDSIQVIEDELGNTNISAIADGTITGSIKKLSDDQHSYTVLVNGGIFGSLSFDFTSIPAGTRLHCILVMPNNVHLIKDLIVGVDITPGSASTQTVILGSYFYGNTNYGSAAVNYTPSGLLTFNSCMIDGQDERNSTLIYIVRYNQ